MSDEQHSLRSFFVDEAKKWATRTAIMLGVGGIVWVFTPLRDQVLAIWHTPDRLVAIEAQLEHILSDVRRATGDDRVIQEQPGQAYVTEPVHVGEDVTLNLVMRRTSAGAGCALLSWVPLFADGSHIDQPGTPISGMHRISTEMTRLKVTATPPETLLPGRATVRLAIEYECAGARVYESTTAVPFVLVP